MEDLDIKLNDIFNLSEENLKNINFKLNKSNQIEDPIFLFYTNKQRFVEYVSWKKGHHDKKAHFSKDRDYVGHFVMMPNSKHQWLFAGIFEIIGEYANSQGIIYEVKEVEKYKCFSGRVIVDYKKKRGYQGTKFKPETMIQEMIVTEILPDVYEGLEFEGYDNVSLTFRELKGLYAVESLSWKTALASVKGIYALTDKSNGKHYIGKADGNEMIWQRWASYISSYHGGDVALKNLLEEKGQNHFEQYFTFTLIETFRSTVADDVINQRESYWKNVLDTRKHGYNLN